MDSGEVAAAVPGANDGHPHLDVALIRGGRHPLLALEEQGAPHLRGVEDATELPVHVSHDLVRGSDDPEEVRLCPLLLAARHHGAHRGGDRRRKQGDHSHPPDPAAPALETRGAPEEAPRALARFSRRGAGRRVVSEQRARGQPAGGTSRLFPCACERLQVRLPLEELAITLDPCGDRRHGLEQRLVDQVDALPLRPGTIGERHEAHAGGLVGGCRGASAGEPQQHLFRERVISCRLEDLSPGARAARIGHPSADLHEIHQNTHGAPPAVLAEARQEPLGLP